MRWPFRRSSGEASSPATQAEQSEGQQSEVQDTAPAVERVAGRTAAWRDLPGGLPVLGAMPSTMEAGFSRTLPSRWHTPPALGPLGHDVRTDVPGGLVSGVARTVDPLDTRPADFVWRLPDPAESATAPLGGVRALTQAESGQGPAGAWPRITAMPRVTAVTTATSTSLPASPVAAQQSATTSSQSSALPAEPSVPSSASATEPSTGTGVRSLSPLVGGTTQTRQALPDAEAAVEARDPRPVPADVTDGPTAAAPDRGVHAEPNPGTPESPPDAPGAGLGTLFTPREARSGSDSQGSAPAVAPLVSRNPLPRASAQPLVDGPGAQASAANGDPSVHGSDVTPNAPVDLPRNDVAGSARADTDANTAAAADASYGPVAGSDAAMQNAEAPASASELDDGSQGASTAAAPAPGQSGAEPQATRQTAAQPTATTPTPPAPSPPPTRTAPLVSATRFVPAAAPISVLQPPTAPVDQPVREAESVIGGYATAAAASGAVPAAVLPGAASAAQAPVSASLASAATSAATALATMTGAAPSRPGSPRAQAAGAVGRARGELSAFSDAASAIEGSAFGDSANELGRMISRPGPSAPGAARSPVAAATAPHDPAALDVLARQLYGRFSRHLAGELLIDRERSQFLTDLH